MASAREREKTRETSLDRAQSARERERERERAAYFFVYEGLVHYLLALGPINILCKSGECKPIFCFSGDFN